MLKKLLGSQPVAAIAKSSAGGKDAAAGRERANSGAAAASSATAAAAHSPASASAAPAAWPTGAASATPTSRPRSTSVQFAPSSPSSSSVRASGPAPASLPPAIALPPSGAAVASSPAASPIDSLPASELRLKLAAAPTAASPFALVSPTDAAAPSSVHASPAPVLPAHIRPHAEWGIFVSTLAGAVSAIQRPGYSVAPAPPSATPPTPEELVAAFLAKQAAKSVDDDGDDDEEEAEAENDDDESVPTSLDAARFHYPTAVCTSRQEQHLLVSDSRRISHVNTARKQVGTLSSVVEGACGLHRDHNGSIWIADTRAHCIRRVTAKGELIHVAGSKKGSAGYVNGAAARFNEPMSICSNGSNSAPNAEKHEPFLLFVADAGNCCVRIITEKGIVSTLVGAGPEGPLSTAASSSSHAARSAASHAAAAAASISAGAPVPPHAVDGPVSLATCVRPVSVAFDHSDSSLLICDAGAHSLRRLTAAGIVWTMAGSTRGESGFQDGAAFRARFKAPASIVCDAMGRIFVADKGNHAIRLLTPNGFVTTIAGDGTPGLANGPGLSSRFYGPSGLALGPAGDLFVCDSTNHVLRKISFVAMPPPRQLEVGNTHATLIREWVEYKEAAEAKQRALEGQVQSLQRELAETRSGLAAEFAKVRQEQMQIMSQLLSSLQAITSDRKV